MTFKKADAASQVVTVFEGVRHTMDYESVLFKIYPTLCTSLRDPRGPNPELSAKHVDWIIQDFLATRRASQ